jgi:hypothetical protein
MRRSKGPGHWQFGAKARDLVDDRKMLRPQKAGYSTGVEESYLPYLHPDAKKLTVG